MYDAVENAGCTDAPTREIVQSLLLPAKRAEAHIYFIIKTLVPMILVGILTLKELLSPYSSI